MNLLYKIIKLLPFILLFACSNNNDEGKLNKNNNKKEKQVTVANDSVTENKYEITEEVYVIDKKSVIFFMPGKEKSAKLYKEIGTNYKFDLDWMFNNFKNQQKYFKRELKKQNIYSKTCYENNFKVIKKDGTAELININKDEQVMGQILFDGIKDAKIEYGMYKNKELAELIKEYFAISNVSYEKDTTLNNTSKTEEVKKDSLN